MSKNATSVPVLDYNALFERIRVIWDTLRGQAARSVNTAHVCANWLIGREIVEREQGGYSRAEYGSEQLQTLSVRLSKEYGSGFSVTSLKYMRLFYLGFPDLLEIRHSVRDDSDSRLTLINAQIGHAVSDILTGADDSSWKPPANCTLVFPGHTTGHFSRFNAGKSEISTR